MTAVPARPAMRSRPCAGRVSVGPGWDWCWPGFHLAPWSPFVPRRRRAPSGSSRSRRRSIESSSATHRVPDCDWLIVQGEADEVVAPAAVRSWHARWAPQARLRMLPGVGHFFHGRLHELQGCIREEWPPALAR